MKKEIRHLLIYGIGLSLNLVFVMIFWIMLFNGSPHILLYANRFNEYWLEFYLLNGILIFQLISFYSLFKEIINTLKTEVEIKNYEIEII